MSQDLPPLNALRAFEATARLSSVSLAAKELHVTHGAISRQLKSLEEQLGSALFVKDGRGLKLTDTGNRLRDASSEAFARLRSVWAELQQSQAEAPFVLACPGSLLARWFIPRLDRLQRDLPELRLQLSASEGELDPRRSGVDATLCFAEPPWPADMQVLELTEERIGPVLSPRYQGHERLHGAPASALLGEPLLHTSSRPQAWPNWAAAQGLDSKALHYGQGFEHLYYLLEAAAAGMGVAIAPQQLVADDLAAGRLLAPWGFVSTPAKLALWRPLRNRDARVERLAQWLQDELRRA
jgi:DNA-binding transcriptional LysR family regulator